MSTRVRRHAISAALVLALATTSVACSGGDDQDERKPAPSASAPVGDDWSPTPRTADGVTVLAEVTGDDLLVHTGDGDRTFLPGVTVGNSVPAGRPGDLSRMRVDDYLDWFDQMHDLGVRVVRTYSLQPPAFYAALTRHAKSFPQAPLYLMQGVGLPEESLADPASTLSSPAVTQALTAELQRVSAAVHGDLPDTSYRFDVSTLLAGWIVGNELDPGLVERTDAAGVGYEAGTYVTTADGASATERWLAHELDVLAAAEHDRGTSAPVAFVSWPSTDPLSHPLEPAADRVTVDPGHVVATDAWPGGTFAAMHAYPYYPDFLRHEPGLAQTRWHGEPDPYAGYLSALRADLEMPVVVAETGVPASIGSAHRGPRGRNQGPYSEQDAMAVDADLVRLAHDQGTSGAFVASWTDEWWRGAWNASAGQGPRTRHRWHDPLTTAQWTGILRSDAPLIPASRAETRGTGRLRRVVLESGADFLHLSMRWRDREARPTRITVDSLPGGGAEYVVEARPARGTVQVLVRADLDPLSHYSDVPLEELTGAGRWHLVRQLTNGQQVVDGQTVAPETSAVGDLVQGTWHPKSRDYDSRATWQVVDGSLRLRLPWSMLGFADPSRRLALAPGRRPKVVRTDGIRVRVGSGRDRAALHYVWPTWREVRPTTRLSAGSDALAAAYEDVVS